MGVSVTYKRSGITCLAAAMALLMAVASAYADWRKDLGVFRIGIIESEALRLSPGEMQRIQTGFADALAMPVEIIRTRDLPALIDAHASSRIEYAIFSAAAYSTAYILCECIEPLVQPVSRDSATGTKTVLFLDATISPLQIPNSKGVAILNRNSLNGYGVPLSANDFPLGKLRGNEPWLISARDMSTAAQQFAEGKVDGFFAVVSSNATLETALQTNPQIATILESSGRKATAVWISATIANGPHASRKSLPDEAKKLLSNYLIGLEETDPDLNDILLPANDVRFALVNHSAYSTALSATKMLATQVGQPAQ